MGNEVEVHLSDVGFDALFRKNNIVVCLISYVFNKQKHCCLLWWVTCRSLLSYGGDVLWAQNGEELLIPMGNKDCIVLKLEVLITHSIAHLGTSETSGVGFLTVCFPVSCLLVGPATFSS